MRFLTVFLFCTAMHLPAAVHSQHVVFSFDLKNATFEDLMKEIRQRSDYYFIYKDSEVASINKLNKRFKSMEVDEILRDCLKGTGLTYSVEDKLIVIRKVNAMFSRDTTENRKAIHPIKGIVVDEKGKPLPGVTVVIKGTNAGVATGSDGSFRLTLPTDTATLIFTFIGMESQQVNIPVLKEGETRKELRVVMKEDEVALEDVVVTGYANIRKSSFTGSATRVKREDILKVSSGNLIDALQVFDASLRVMRNNEMGSDPNTLPEFYIRGRSGIASVKELDVMQSSDLSEFALTSNPNLPIFILDGFEISVEKVYDFDMNRIQDITILKDAAATAVYGSRASNGVIVIETAAPQAGEFQVNYSGNLMITSPDLSSYNLMNAKEKLDAEWAAGLYEPWGLSPAISPESELNQLMEFYIEKRNRVLIGTDNYWLSQPLQTEVNHKHSLYMEGGAEHIRFGIELRYDNENGVMKKSLRDRVGAGVTLDYRYKGLQIRNKISYDLVKAKDSPYGSFWEYASKQPYEYWRDPNSGKLLEHTTVWGNYGGSTKNPLYEASLGSFSKNDYTELVNNLSLNWYVDSYLLIKGQFAITSNVANASRFTDPASRTYAWADLSRKGDLLQSVTKTNGWNLNLFGAYNRVFGKHNVNFSAGINLVSKDFGYSTSYYRGFPDKDRHSPAYAYEIVSKPNFSDNKTRLFGAFLTLNYSFRDIYLFDASYRFDGSSEFGANKKWAPFWSVGTGINFHRYNFWRKIDFITLFKLKANIGETGKAKFKPFMARNTYRIQLDDWYPTGIGAEPVYMGNKDLTWEKQLSWNIGAEMGFWHGRIMLNIDVYNKRTKDLITDVSLPASSGFPKYTDNTGEIENKGFEVGANLRLYSDEDWSIVAFGNMAHNKNRILKVSESLKEYNERVNKHFSNYATYDGVPQLMLNSGYDEMIKYVKPIMKYEEGSSLTAIYGMKSLGINPANGREVYLKRDGTITYDWTSAEEQPIGDKEPWAQGAFGLNIRFKNFTLYTTFLYEFGGDLYNETLIANVENANLNSYNADKRVWMERWKKVGDVTPLKSIKDRYHVTRPTSRFVQKKNELVFNSLSVGYNFDRQLLKRIRCSALRLQFNMKDIVTLSTIKREMGLTYPFARTFTFSLNANF